MNPKYTLDELEVYFQSVQSILWVFASYTMPKRDIAAGVK